MEKYKKTRLQSRIQNPIKYLWWSISAKIQWLKAVKYFCKKASSQMFGMVLNIPLGLCKTLKLIWNELVPKSWRKLCISSIWILQEIPYVGIPKISEATVCKCSTKQSFLKITQKFTVMHLHRRLFFNLQPATLLKKRRRHTYFSVNFAKFLGKTL